MIKDSSFPLHQPKTDSSLSQLKWKQPRLKITLKPPLKLIILGKPSDSNEFMNTMKQQIKGHLFFNYTKNNTNLYMVKTDGRDKILNYLKEKENNTEFYTYTQKNSKYITHNPFVLRGLDNNPALAVIETDLKNMHGLNV